MITPPVFPAQDDLLKTELVHDADIRQALHKDGNWYLIPKQYCFQYVANRYYRNGKELSSLVFHVCTKSWLVKSFPDDAGVEHLKVLPYTCHRKDQESMSGMCNYCKESPPESVVGLWILHNWDYLSENDHHA
jgi:hypothetical protein